MGPPASIRFTSVDFLANQDNKIILLIFLRQIGGQPYTLNAGELGVGDHSAVNSTTHLITIR